MCLRAHFVDLEPPLKLLLFLDNVFFEDFPFPFEETLTGPLTFGSHAWPFFVCIEGGHRSLLWFLEILFVCCHQCFWGHLGAPRNLVKDLARLTWTRQNSMCACIAQICIACDILVRLARTNVFTFRWLHVQIQKSTRSVRAQRTNLCAHAHNILTPSHCGIGLLWHVQPQMSCTNLENGSNASGLVKMSTTWSSVAIWMTLIFGLLPLQWEQKWWCSALMCLVLGRIFGVLASSQAPELSSNAAQCTWGAQLSLRIPHCLNSSNKDIKGITLRRAALRATHSLSVVEREHLDCDLEAQMMGHFAKVIRCPALDLSVLWSSATVSLFHSPQKLVSAKHSNTGSLGSNTMPSVRVPNRKRPMRCANLVWDFFSSSLDLAECDLGFFMAIE